MSSDARQRDSTARRWPMPVWIGLVFVVALFLATLDLHSAPAHHGSTVPVDYCLTIVFGSVVLVTAGGALLRRPSIRAICLRIPSVATSAATIRRPSRFGFPHRPPLIPVLRC